MTASRTAPPAQHRTLLAALLLTSTALAGCTLPVAWTSTVDPSSTAVTSSTTPGPSQPGAATPGASVTSSAVAALEQLTVSAETEQGSYHRKAFGPSWADVDGNGCDTRDDILARDLADPVIDADGCTVRSGTLTDPYTGTTLPFTRGVDTSRDVPVDHRVPLAEGWASGAAAWTLEQRQAFANDTANLVATTEEENSAKSDRDPAEWMPTAPAAWCGYASAYVQVKATWRLSVDERERDALRDVLAAC